MTKEYRHINFKQWWRHDKQELLEAYCAHKNIIMPRDVDVKQAMIESLMNSLCEKYPAGTLLEYSYSMQAGVSNDELVKIFKNVGAALKDFFVGGWSDIKLLGTDLKTIMKTTGLTAKSLFVPVDQDAFLKIRQKRQDAIDAIKSNAYYVPPPSLSNINQDLLALSFIASPAAFAAFIAANALLSKDSSIAKKAKLENFKKKLVTNLIGGTTGAVVYTSLNSGDAEFDEVFKRKFNEVQREIQIPEIDAVKGYKTYVSEFKQFVRRLNDRVEQVYKASDEDQMEKSGVHVGVLLDKLKSKSPDKQIVIKQLKVAYFKQMLEFLNKQDIKDVDLNPIKNKIAGYISVLSK